MTAAIWYYIDTAGAQVGPMDAEAMRSALNLDRASLSSLAWREGLADWVPLSQLAGELGLPTGAPSLPPPPPANGNAAAQAPRQDSASGSQRLAEDVVPAGFVRRWAALFLDQLILSIPLTVVFFVLWAVVIGDSVSQASALMAQGLFYVVYLVAAALYYAGMESSDGQATLGKRALGIKVCDMDGRRIGFGHALGRWFAAALSYLTLYLGFLMAAFTERKRALHDFVAGTQVVDKWAYTPSPERQQRGLPGCLVAFLIAMLLCLVVVPILAAIAVSQYQDYVIRSQVSEASSLADGVKIAVGEYVSNQGSFPASNAVAGLPEAAQINGAYVAQVDIGVRPGSIDASFSARSPQRANIALDGKHLYFEGTLGKGSLMWSCRSDDLKQKWCPRSCSCSG